MAGKKVATTTADTRTRRSRSVDSNETATQILPLFRDVTPLTRPPGMPPKRAEMITQRIVHMIQEQGLKAGDPLPIETDMYEMFGVARSTLREALRILERQGVIVIRPGRGGGPTVGSPDSRHLASTLALLMQFSDTPFRSVLETREYIEPIAAALCAQNGDERVINGLRQSVDAMRASLADESAFLYENHRFHELIADGAQNPLISYFLNSLDWIIDGARLGVVYSHASRKHVAVIHDQICEAIEDGDSDRARDAMSEHMQETRAFFERKHPKVMNQTLTWEMYGQ
ncbi:MULTISPECIES: FadR/GntR family transcriptional regulator [unclassified Rhodococcus (in: high G+C Gram-positive bacteria)]|uniref:FadR/GntR family transcriptional regulator n=1 Tax=unclassified Rhodococcus (in: high G+C Gram-positive bacteria) TaxID=192944 RepID=UPI001C52831F|nr:MULTISPECIES: FadR/GntR family transcriptional regulator [unclassified Rhodococcus (in: high G+C Gram-positive bacteria)]